MDERAKAAHGNYTSIINNMGVKYEAALLQLQDYSDNALVIQGEITYNIEDELKNLNLGL